MVYEKIFKKIEEYETITVFGHINPDGDCYGSQIGLVEGLKSMYPKKKIVAVGKDFSRRPEILPHIEDVLDETICGSLAFVLDVANLARIGDQRYAFAKEIIKIDHHILQDEFGVISIVDNDKVATCQIITDLLFSKVNHLPVISSSALFLGIVTDSGRFMYKPVSSELFITTAKLLNSGAEAGLIYDKLYEVDPSSLKFKGYIFSNYKISPQGVVYLALTKEVLAEYGIDYNYGASLVNTIGGIIGTNAWVFFAESPEGEVRVEFRSGEFPVQPIATSFGGGGHKCAAGCKLKNINEYSIVIAALDNALAAASTEVK